MAKSLLEKLGHRGGTAGWAYGRPDALADLLPLPRQAPIDASCTIAFVGSKAEVAPALDAALPHYRRGGHFWMAYPKKSGRIATDISRDAGWEPLAAHDLLPVTQVAIDEDWSALRFRYRDEIPTLTRKRDRP